MLNRFAIVALIAFSCLAAACGRDIDVDNLLGRVTSIGPVYEQSDGSVKIHFSVYDLDGDPTDVSAEYRFGDSGAWQLIPECRAGQTDGCEIFGGLTGLATDPDVEVQHQVSWEVPEQLRGRTIQLRMRATRDVSRGVESSVFIPPG